MTEQKIIKNQKWRDENERLVHEYLSKGGQVKKIDLGGFPTAKTLDFSLSDAVSALQVANQLSISVSQLSCNVGTTGFPQHYSYRGEAYFKKDEMTRWTRKRKHAGTLGRLSGAVMPKKVKKNEDLEDDE